MGQALSYKDIQKAVNDGLRSANLAIGAQGSNAIKTYLITSELQGASNPYGEDTYTDTYTELVNAVWVTVDSSLIDGENILQGDRALTSSADVPISVGDRVTTGQTSGDVTTYGKEYRVVSVNDVSAANYSLVNKSVLRAI